MGKSDNIKKTDGRKNNKRLAPKPISTTNKMVKPARTTKAKKDRVASYAISAMKEVFGSEKDAFIHMAELAKSNFSQMQLLMQYAYGRPSDKIDSGSNRARQKAPVINFNIGSNDVKQIEQTFDISHEEEE